MMKSIATKRMLSSALSLLFLLLPIISLFCANTSFAAHEVIDETPSSDGTDPIPEDVVHATSVYLYNIDSHTLLYEQASTKSVAPSSTARLMLAIVAIENISDFDAVVTVSAEAVRKARLTYSNKIELVANETVTLRTLLYGVIMYGAHDAAYALAERVFGSSKKAISAMNAKASELGMNATRYVNVTGDKADGSYTCASDVGKLALYAFENPIFTDMASETYLTIAKLGSNGARTIYTQNYLQSKRTFTDYYNSAVTGMNAAGFDRNDKTMSGYCSVSTAVIENLNYLCVIMDAENINEKGESWYYAFSIPTSLFEWAKKNFAYRNVLSSTVILGEIKVNLATDSDYVSVIPSKKLEAFLPLGKDLSELMKTEVTMFYTVLTAPVAEGMVVGKVVVSMEGEVVCEADLVTKNSLNLSKWQAYRAKALTLTETKQFKWAVAALIAFAVIAVFVTARVKYVKAHRIRVHVRDK